MPKHKTNVNMGEPLKFWRKEKGFSQIKLAELAQTSALTISQLETGNRKARTSTLQKLLDGLGLTKEEFFAQRKDGAAISPAVPSIPDSAQAVGTEAAITVPVKETSNVKLSNLDLELLNRILNLDFDGKLECLRFLQNL